MIFLVGAAISVLFTMDTDRRIRSGAFYLLVIIATLGMSLMAAAADLITLYLAIETTSIPLYVLSGSLVKDQKSTEAGVKYMLFGAFTSAIMLYGFSLLYGFTGTTNLYELKGLLESGQISTVALVAVAMLVLAGFGFKISAVPFHFWAPDVYEGAPTPVAGYLSTASKAAGFAVLLRFLNVVFPDLYPTWLLVALLSVATMIIGNVLALTQKNIKRLLAYSSIAQAGYMLIGVAAATELGNTAAIFYLISYLVTNLAAFGIVVVVGQSVGSDEIAAYAGLSRRSPGLALALLVALLSLGGVPPFAGFIGKLFVFAAAVQADMIWLAIIGIINSVIALYYYLVVLKVVWLNRSDNEEEKLPVTRSWRLAVVVCVAGMLLLGTIFAPWYQWALQAATAF
jgi:NADH-quinone oxidoreductase subunit N